MSLLDEYPPNFFIGPTDAQLKAAVREATYLHTDLLKAAIRALKKADKEDDLAEMQIWIEAARRSVAKVTEALDKTAAWLENQERNKILGLDGP